MLSCRDALGGVLLVGILLFCGCAAAAPGETPRLQGSDGTATLAAATTVPAEAQATTTAPADAPTIVPVREGQSIKPPKAGEKAVEFTLYDLKGRPLALADLRGKAVMLNFCASWCGPCDLEMPDIVALYPEYHERGLEIVAIDVAEKPDRVEAFVKRHHLPFTMLLDRGGEVRQAYCVRGMPTSVFIDGEGIIRAVHLGGLTQTMLRGYLDDLMGGGD